MWLFSDFFNELYFLSWVNLFASGLFKLMEFYYLELLLLPPLCGIIACHGLAVQL